MIVAVYGTRPERLKTWPLLKHLKDRGHDVTQILTGQHTSLMHTGLPELDLPTLDLQMASPGHPHPWQYGEFLVGHLKPHLQALNPRLVLVQGDTISAWVGAHAAKELGIPVGHVEAGLRTHDLADPYPEEQIRTQITALAKYHFCPTTHNRTQIQREGRTGPVVGNTITDTLRLMGISPAPESPHVLLTLHRYENRKRFHLIWTALKHFCLKNPHLKVIWVSHPNRLAEIKTEGLGLQGLHNLIKMPPQPYPAFIRLLQGAKAVFTDSGGCVEEATTLGVPSCILRLTTERPEAILKNLAILADTDSPMQMTDRMTTTTLLDREPSSVYGTGHTSEAIVEHLEGAL